MVYATIKKKSLMQLESSADIFIHDVARQQYVSWFCNWLGVLAATFVSWWCQHWGPLIGYSRGGGHHLQEVWLHDGGLGAQPIQDSSGMKAMEIYQIQIASAGCSEIPNGCRKQFLFSECRDEGGCCLHLHVCLCYWWVIFWWLKIHQ